MEVRKGREARNFSFNTEAFPWVCLSSQWVWLKELEEG